MPRFVSPQGCRSNLNPPALFALLATMWAVPALPQDCSVSDVIAGVCAAGSSGAIHNLPAPPESQAERTPVAGGSLTRGPLGGIIGVPKGYYACALYDEAARRCLVRAPTEAEFEDAVRVGIESSNAMAARHRAIFDSAGVVTEGPSPGNASNPMVKSGAAGLGTPLDDPLPANGTTEEIAAWVERRRQSVLAYYSGAPTETHAAPPSTGAPSTPGIDTALPNNATQSNVELNQVIATSNRCAAGQVSIAPPTEGELIKLCLEGGECQSVPVSATQPCVPFETSPAGPSCIDELDGQPVSGPHLNVFFINGVKTDPVTARSHLAALRGLVVGLRLPLQICAKSLVNSSEGLFGWKDFREVNVLLSDEAWTSWVSSQLERYKSETMLNVQKIASALSAPDSRGALLVAHSEGNLFANQMHKLLAEKYKIGFRSFQIVGVGVPAPYVGGISRYATAHEDLVIYGLRAKMKLPFVDNKKILPPNIHVKHRDPNAAIICWLCHGFDDTYINPDFSEPRGTIEGLISEAIRELRHNQNL